MTLQDIKNALNDDQVGQKPDWRDKTKMREITGYDGVGLLRDEEASFTVDKYVFSPEESFGGEGQGDDYWVVFSVSEEGEPKKFYKIPGWYASHHGGELEVSNTFEVKAVQKTITVWEASSDNNEC